MPLIAFLACIAFLCVATYGACLLALMAYRWCRDAVTTFRLNRMSVQEQRQWVIEKAVAKAFASRDRELREWRREW